MRLPLSAACCALIVIVVGLSSCGSDPATPADQTIVQSTTTTTIDEWAIPETVDAAYLDKVINRIEQVRAEVRRDVISTRQFSEANKEKFEAIYAEPALDFQLSLFEKSASEGIDGVASDAGAVVYATKEILYSGQGCIWLRANADPRDVKPSAEVSEVEFALVVAQHDRSVNPSPWVERQAQPAHVITEREQMCQ